MPKIETHEIKPAEADPILKQSWEEAKTPEGASVHIPPERRIPERQKLTRLVRVFLFAK